MPEPDPLIAWLTVASLTLALLTALGTAVLRYVVLPVRRSHAMLHELKDTMEYHLEPNGTETRDEQEERRPMRAIALRAERDVSVVKADLEGQTARWTRHEGEHAAERRRPSLAELLGWRRR